MIDERKGSLPINISFNLIASLAIVLFLLAILMPLILGQRDAASCLGMFRFPASMLADITGVSIC